MNYPEQNIEDNFDDDKRGAVFQDMLGEDYKDA